MGDSIIALQSFSHGSVDPGALNQALMPTGSDSLSEETLLADINVKKKALLAAYQRYQSYINRDTAQLFTNRLLFDFLVNNPEIIIRVSGTDVVLEFYNQVLRFHCGHSAADTTVNEDILYVSAPKHSGAITFTGSGKVRICRLQTTTLKKVLEPSPEVTDFVQTFRHNSNWGHPHTTGPSRGTGQYGTICQGTNRFLNDYEDMHKKENLSNYSAATLLAMFTRATIWHKHVNMNDMFGTSPIEYIPTFNYQAIYTDISQCQEALRLMATEPDGSWFSFIPKFLEMFPRTTIIGRMLREIMLFSGSVAALPTDENVVPLDLYFWIRLYDLFYALYLDHHLASGNWMSSKACWRDCLKADILYYLHAPVEQLHKTMSPEILVSINEAPFSLRAPFELRNFNSEGKPDLSWLPATFSEWRVEAFKARRPPVDRPTWLCQINAE